MKKIKYLPIALSIFLAACSAMPEIDDATMLDGDQIFDLSLTQPEKYLVSSYIPNPTSVQKNTPVIIAAHGYSATTFEWDELRKYADEKGTFYVSQVLLGGHGRTYDQFKASTWHDWQQSIKDEYKRLTDLGFKKIFLVGSSTGGPLVMEMFQEGYFDQSGMTKPSGAFLVDPIVASSDKNLTIVELVGPLLGFTSTTMTAGEAGHWYTYRPQETLQQLQSLCDEFRIELQKGITMTPGATLTVFKSEIDDVADPLAAVLIYKGVRLADGTHPKVIMVNSELHVFTRLEGRENVKISDHANQLAAFQEMEREMLN